MAYVINLYNLGCTPGVSSTVVAEWLKPENRPDVLQGLPVDEVFGSDADHNRELLVGQLEGEVERLRAEADRLAREVDGPSLVAVLERAAILTEKAARRVTRSHAEARTTYHRASSALWPMLEREKEEGSPESVGDDDDATRPVTHPAPGLPRWPRLRRKPTSRAPERNPRRAGLGCAGAGLSGGGQRFPKRTRGFVGCFGAKG